MTTRVIIAVFCVTVGYRDWSRKIYRVLSISCVTSTVYVLYAYVIQRTI